MVSGVGDERLPRLYDAGGKLEMLDEGSQEAR